MLYLAKKNTHFSVSDTESKNGAAAIKGSVNEIMRVKAKKEGGVLCYSHVAVSAPPEPHTIRGSSCAQQIMPLIFR